MKSPAVVAAVLFDLDGTLADTAPDLIGTLQVLRSRRQLPPLPESLLRHQASRGALGLLEAGFADQPGLEWRALRPEFLEHYAENLWVRSRPFAGIEAVLDALAEAGLVMAVVTNKPGFLTEPLLLAAGWDQRFACVISGDTVARSKPAPDPVLAACHRI
ncbi:MAG: HAD hydrolase-like protein, partial [Wenzhouxiangella sp.]|nr:HAD hydrolase-like protein [Wenzhouxiangella sp.]